MSTARKILSNTVAQVLGKAFVAILGLAVVKISTSYLSVEGYGEYVLVYEFLAFFGIAADLGLFTIAVKEMSEDEDKVATIIGNIISLRTILVLATMATAVIAAFTIPKYQGTRIPFGVAIASITVIITILNGTITSVLQAKLKMQIASVATILGKLVSVLFMFYIVFYGFPNDNETGFYMLLVAGIAGSLVMLLTTGYYVRKITPLNYRFDIDLWKQVLIKALPYGIALILNTIYFRIDSILISLMRGQREVGIYGVAMKMLEHFAILPLYFMNSVLPVLTKSLKSGVDKTSGALAETAQKISQKSQDIISYSFDFLAALAVPMVVGGVLLAYPIVFIVSTPDFLSDLNSNFFGSDIAFQILVFALLFQFLNVLFAFILIAVDQQKKLLYINAACVLFNLVANYMVIPEYGFRGAAVTSVLSEMFILIANFYYARKYVNFKINLKNLAKIILSAALMGFAVFYLKDPTYALIQNWNVLLLVVLGALIYLALLFLTRAIDHKMLRTIIRK